MRLFCLFLCTGILACTSHPSDRGETKAEIESLLMAQQDAWNAGDLDKFMEGYWKSDSLQFIGRSIRMGWQATLDGYRTGYPNRKAMGTLAFDIWQVRPLDGAVWLVSGAYTLQREEDTPTGRFTLLFQRKDGRWVIVYDHTC